MDIEREQYRAGGVFLASMLISGLLLAVMFWMMIA